MKLAVIKGDITRQKVEAIVNAANSSLMGGGGVDGAIHKAGGPGILEECKQIRKKNGGCKVGTAVATTAGQLQARKVIHTVGPVWYGGSNGEPELLASCYESSLKLAEENGLKSIAFPNISTGAFGYPKSEAAGIALQTVRDYNSDKIEEVLFVCFDDENYDLYKVALK